jgi:pre-mRNA-splicing factor SYF1
MTTVVIYRRYLQVDPALTERYVNILLSKENGARPRPLEAAKLLLQLARKAARGEYTSPEGKSPYQLLGEWLDVVEQYADEVGMDLEDVDTLRAAEASEQKRKGAEVERIQIQVEKERSEAPASVDGKLIRFGGPPIAVKPAETSKQGGYDEDEDPASLRKLDVERIVKKDGLAVYKDQGGRLWSGLAIYWTKRGEFDRVRILVPLSHLTISHLVDIVNRPRGFSKRAWDQFSPSATSHKFLKPMPSFQNPSSKLLWMLL